MNQSEDPYPRHGSCSQCTGRLLPDGICPTCFNRRRWTIILWLLCSGLAVGLVLAAASSFVPPLPDRQGLKAWIAFFMLICSGFGGIVPAVIYGFIVPEEKALHDIRHREHQLLCPVCRRWMESGSPPWCSRCSGLRLRKIMVALGVGVPILGIGACDALFTPIGETLYNISPALVQGLMNAAWASLLGPAAAGLIWILFSRLAGRRRDG